MSFEYGLGPNEKCGDQVATMGKGKELNDGPRDAGAEERRNWIDWLEAEGELDQAEMLKTFNCGIGMAIVTPAAEAAAVAASLSAAGETVVELGTIREASNWPQRVRYG